ncbi:MAG: serpin family protein [Chloroflexota bacterium]
MLGVTRSLTASCKVSHLSETQVNEGLFINDALHKATISVDEQGTEATGVTSSVLVPLMGIAIESENSCAHQITADRPFVFIIYDRQTTTILFLGQVTNPVVVS